MRTSPVHYIAPSAITITPNANNSANDLAVYIARNTKIKLYTETLIALLQPIDGNYQEWALTGRNRRLADADSPYTIYARLNRQDHEDGYLVFVKKDQLDEDTWVDHWSTPIVGGNGYSVLYTDEHEQPVQRIDQTYWYVKLGNVELPEYGARSMDLDTGILGTEQYNSEWTLYPDSLPLRVLITNSMNAGVPYVKWGESIILTARLRQGWETDASSKVHHWTIQRNSGNAAADATWNAIDRSATFGQTGRITLQHIFNGNDDLNAAVAPVFTIKAWGVETPEPNESSSALPSSSGEGNEDPEPTYIELAKEDITILAETVKKYSLELSAAAVTYDPQTQTFAPAGGVNIRVKCEAQDGTISYADQSLITAAQLHLYYLPVNESPGEDPVPELTFVDGTANLPTSAFADGKSLSLWLENTAQVELARETVAYVKNGVDGTAGGNSATVMLYKRSASAVSTVGISRMLYYKFSAKKLYTNEACTTEATSSDLNGWSLAIPSDGIDPIYVTAAIAYSQTDVDDIGTNEWVAPAHYTENGEPGEHGVNSATVMLYKRSATAISSHGITTTLYYKFSDGKLYKKNGSTYTEATNSDRNNWLLEMPATDGNPCYVIQAAALSSEDYDQIATTDWSGVRKIVEDGDDGVGIVSITQYYQISASGEAGAGRDYPSDITSWLATSPAVTEQKPYLWKKEVIVYTDETMNTTTYSCVGARGDRGVDAKDVEWVYIRTKTNIAPVIDSDISYTDSNGNTYDDDDHLPKVVPGTGGSASDIEMNNSGDVSKPYECTDDPQGVDGTWKYEWEIKRTKGAEASGHRTWDPYTGEMTLHNNLAENGAPGGNSATVMLYKRSASAVSTVGISRTLYYKFSAKKLYTNEACTTEATSSDLNGWSLTIPSDGIDPIYVTAAIAYSQTDVDDVGSNEWVEPAHYTENGEPGEHGVNSATVFLYKRSATAISSHGITTTLYYKFADGKLYKKNGSTYTEATSSDRNNWLLEMPATNGNPCYVIQAAALSSENYDQIATTDWSGVRKIVEDGEQGEPGEDALVIGIDPASPVYLQQKSENMAGDASTDFGLPMNLYFSAKRGSTSLTNVKVINIPNSSGVNASVASPNDNTCSINSIAPTTVGQTTTWPKKAYFYAVVQFTDVDGETKTDTVKVWVYITYLGTFKTEVKGDVETSIATSMGFVDPETGEIEWENVATYIRSSSAAISTLESNVVGVNLMPDNGFTDNAGEVTRGSYFDEDRGRLSGLLWSPLIYLAAGTYTLSYYMYGTAPSPHAATARVFISKPDAPNSSLNHTDMSVAMTEVAGDTYLTYKRYKGTLTLAGNRYVYIQLPASVSRAIYHWQLELNGDYDTPTKWVEGPKTYKSEISQTATEIRLQVEETGVNITDGTIDLYANKVNFKMPGGSTNPKISIDPTTGTLHAVDGNFDGTVRARNLFRTLAVSGGSDGNKAKCVTMIDAETNVSWIYVLQNVPASTYGHAFTAGEYLTNVEFASLVDVGYETAWKDDYSNFRVCTGPADEVLLVNPTGGVHSGTTFVPRCQDMPGKTITIRNNGGARGTTATATIMQVDGASVFIPGATLKENSDGTYDIDNGSHTNVSESLVTGEGVILYSTGTVWSRLSKFQNDIIW